MKAAPRARFGASAITAWGRLGGWPQVLLNQYFMENQEHSKELCEQAAKEQDPEKLMQLTKKIIRLLNEKDARLKHLHRPTDPQKPQA